jgi:3-dehydroquinate synthase
MLRMECSTTRSYDVVITSDVLALDNPALTDSVVGERGLVVLDARLEATYGRQLRRHLARLPGFAVLVVSLTEHDKNMRTVLEICSAAEQHGLGRRDTLVAVGGGVCCDVVSVAASLVRRGIPYVTVPTTLLAQVDAGIALKGGVNFAGHKNYLGSFRPPERVLVDPGFLLTLDPAELRSGVAEMVKMAVVRDGDLLRDLRQHGPRLLDTGFTEPAAIGRRVIARSIALMLDELAANPYEELGLRRLVDFGHTVSPRLEELSGYTVRHGEAVAVDMAVSSALATELGLLGEGQLCEILSTLHELGLPLHSPLLTDASVAEALEAAVGHRAGALNLVVPTGLGVASFLPSVSDVLPGAMQVARRRVATYSRLTTAPRPASTVPRQAGAAPPARQEPRYASTR